MKNITKILLAAAFIGATQTEAKTIRLDAQLLGHFSRVNGQQAPGEGDNQFKPDYLPSAAGTLLNLAIHSDCDFPLQGGLVILAGAGVSTDTNNATGDKTREAGFYTELMGGPSLRLQFGFFGFGLAYLLGRDGSRFGSEVKDDILGKWLIHGLLLKFDFDLKSTVLSVGAGAFKKWNGSEKTAPTTMKVVAGFGKKLI